jgi:hypothetical protein
MIIHVKRLIAVSVFFLIIVVLLVAFLAFCNFNIFIAFAFIVQSPYSVGVALAAPVIIIPTVLYLIEKYL